MTTPSVWLVCLAITLVVAACTSHSPARDPQTSPSAGQQRTPTLDRWDRDRTALALGTTVGIDHDLVEHLTEEARQEEFDYFQLTRPVELATQGAIMQVTEVAAHEEQFKEELRQCVQDGFDETLCLRDPQAAYDPEVKRCIRDGHTVELCLFDPQAPYEP